jgi:hypothetical protein
MSIAAKFRRLANLYKLLWGFDELDQIASRTGAQLDVLKSSLEVPPEMVDEFLAWKSQNPIPSHPLVTVIVATYNRSRLLTERCIPSILGQTYANLELIPADGASRLEPISPHQVPRPGSDEVSRTAAKASSGTKSAGHIGLMEFTSTL